MCIIEDKSSHAVAAGQNVTKEYHPDTIFMRDVSLKKRVKTRLFRKEIARLTNLVVICELGWFVEDVVCNTSVRRESWYGQVRGFFGRPDTRDALWWEFSPVAT